MVGLSWSASNPELAKSPILPVLRPGTRQRLMVELAVAVQTRLSSITTSLLIPSEPLLPSLLGVSLQRKMHSPSAQCSISTRHMCWTSTTNLTRRRVGKQPCRYIDTNRAHYIYRNDEPNSKHRHRRNQDRVMSYNTQQHGARSVIRIEYLK